MTLQELAKNINEVVEYNWADEFQNWLENDCPEGHIFAVLVELDNWANSTNYTLDHYDNREPSPCTTD